MANAKVVALKSRPYQVSHLCFPVHGIIEDLRQLPTGFRHEAGKPIPVGSRSLQLGDSLPKFDFVSFYAGLRQTTSQADPSLLTYNSSGILSDLKVQTSLLMKLRGESIGAALDKAIAARQNAFYAKYAAATQSNIIAVMQQFFKASNIPGAPLLTTTQPGYRPPFVNMSKPDMLAHLSNVTQTQDLMLQGAYAVSDPRQDGVVRNTFSILETYGNFPDTTQTVRNTDYGFRIPSCESAAQNLRAQISLIDQQFAQFMSSQNLPHLKQVFDNELLGIDLDIKRLQIAYLDTILMSPIDGVITGIYKNAGDWVQAGEPVIRIEDNSSVNLVGTLRYQGSITIGSAVTVTTSLFDSAGMPPLTGGVLAVRGHPDEDDLWDVHVLCANQGPSVLPINYQFDYDNTSVTITP
jgi:hypothetical protein